MCCSGWPRRGWSRSGSERIERDPFASGGSVSAVVSRRRAESLTDEQASALEALGAAAATGRVRRVSAAGGHRLRQDRGVSAACRSSCCSSGRIGARAGAGDRAHARRGRRRFAMRSAIAWPCSTAACRTASDPISGTASGAARCRSWSARARRCLRHSRTSGSSSSTKSTTRRSSRKKRRATTGATWRWCAAETRVRSSCSARRRRRSRAARTRRAAATRAW